MKRKRWNEIKTNSKKMKYSWIQGEHFYKIFAEDSNAANAISGKFSEKFKLEKRSIFPTTFSKFTGQVDIMGHFWLHTGPTGHLYYFKAKMFEHTELKEIHFYWDKEIAGIDLFMNAFQKVLNFYYSNPIGGLSIYIEDIENNYCGIESVKRLVNYVVVELRNKNHFYG